MGNGVVEGVLKRKWQHQLEPHLRRNRQENDTHRQRIGPQINGDGSKKLRHAASRNNQAMGKWMQLF
jgi:hypothetical protein